MSVSTGKPGTMILPRIQTAVRYLIVLFTFFISMWRIFLWDVINPLLHANTDRLMTLFGLSEVQIRIDWTTLVKLLCLFVIVSVLVLLAVGNQTVRGRGFWLMSLPLLAVLVLAVCSQFWSINVESTVKRSWFLLAVALGGVYIGLEFKRARIVLFIEILSVLCVLLSYAFVFVYPRQAIMTFDIPGAWRGIFDYKNFSGVMIGFASLVFLFRLLNFRNESWFVRLYAGVFLLISLYFLHRTMNATALFALILSSGVLILGLLFIKFGRRLRPAHWGLIGMLLLALLILVWVQKDALLGLLGRNSSLTGRIPMWLTLIPFIQQQLWFGYGFGEAFFLSDYLAEFWLVAPWPARFAHSGYMEALVDTGLVGLVFWLAFIVEELILSVMHFFRQRTLYSLIFIALSVFGLFNNLTENLLGSYEIFIFLLLVIAFAFTAQEHLAGTPSAGEPTE